MIHIAFFDFDETITTDDSLLKFIRFFMGDLKSLARLGVLFPIRAIYQRKLIPNYMAKQMMLSYFFKGMGEKKFMQVISNKYSLEHIDPIVRPKALEKICWHQSQGNNVVVVSTSLECWLKAWCEKNVLELLATKLKAENGIVRGQFLTKKCYGIEKGNRINDIITISTFIPMLIEKVIVKCWL